MHVTPGLKPHLAIDKFAMLIRLPRRYDCDLRTAYHDADRIEIMAV
jgi:hypothetical protein